MAAAEISSRHHAAAITGGKTRAAIWRESLLEQRSDCGLNAFSYIACKISAEIRGLLGRRRLLE